MPSARSFACCATTFFRDLKLAAKLQALLVVVALSLLIARAGQLMWVTAQHSLWGDEIVSVERFSGQGLATCLSDYSIPNNHVLFNAINSVLPGAGSFDPLRARAVSFVAVTLGLLVGIVAMLRRRAWLVLLAFAIAYLGDDRLLAVHLGARGYGMLACAAVMVCLLVWRYLEDEQSRWQLAALAASVLVGVMTVPTFLFFGGSVLLALFCLRPSRLHFFTGLTVFVLSAGYWGWMYLSNHGLAVAPAGFFEGEFHEWSAPLKLAQLFTLEGWPALVRYLAIAFALLAPWLVAPKTARRSVALCLWLGILGSLTICLVMQRPLMHTVAHVLIPAGFLIGFGLEALSQQWQRSWRGASTMMVLVLTVVAAASALRPRDQLQLWPAECWRELAVAIDAVTGSEKIEVWAPYRSQNLEKYLSPERKLSDGFADHAFRNGQQLVVKSAISKYADDVVPDSVVAAADVKLAVRQKAGGYQMILCNPRVEQRLKLVGAIPKPGTSSGKTLVLDLDLPQSPLAGKTLYVYADGPIMHKPPVVRAKLSGEKFSKKLPALAIGQLWAIQMPENTSGWDGLEMVFYSSLRGDSPPGFVAWLGSELASKSVRQLVFQPPLN